MKGPNDLSSSYTFVDLSLHLSRLELSLTEVIDRLSSYVDHPSSNGGSSLLNSDCFFCDGLLRDGVLAVGRGWWADPSGGRWVAFHTRCYDEIH